MQKPRYAPKPASLFQLFHEENSNTSEFRVFKTYARARISRSRQLSVAIHDECSIRLNKTLPQVPLLRGIHPPKQSDAPEKRDIKCYMETPVHHEPCAKPSQKGTARPKRFSSNATRSINARNGPRFIHYHHDSFACSFPALLTANEIAIFFTP